jgi:phosphotransferase system enzyme I (PtsI)
LHDALNPAVLELIGRVAAHGVRTGCEVSLCGDMAAEPASLTRLLDAGVRAVSVAPAALARTKAAIARNPAGGDGGDGGDDR